VSKEMTIGELSQQAGITPRTVRHYESLGLLPKGRREGKGYHYYSEESLARLSRIQVLKRLGLSLEEIREVIDLYFQDAKGLAGKTKVLEILEGHLKDVDSKIKELEAFRAEIKRNIVTLQSWIKDAQHR
jgi:MerR family transcriptional regulator, copper efflux regulator